MKSTPHFYRIHQNKRIGILIHKHLNLLCQLICTTNLMKFISTGWRAAMTCTERTITTGQESMTKILPCNPNSKFCYSLKREGAQQSSNSVSVKLNQLHIKYALWKNNCIPPSCFLVVSIKGSHNSLVATTLLFFSNTKN